MARNSKSLTKAIRTMRFSAYSGDNYIDIPKCLSIVNRKLMSQGHVYGIESIQFTYDADVAAVSSIRVTAYTAGDSWSVHNAWVKGNALWNQMNQLVLEDNPSIQGKWADFKVYLDSEHRAADIAGLTLLPRDGDGNLFNVGEWNYSDYVLPQHIVDPATGLPLLADQTQAHLIGPDVSIPGNPTEWASVGLVNAYQESRATVFADAPNVPPGMSQSFFNILTDSGSQEPELADIIEGENNDPPYDINDYPGGAINGPHPIVSELGAASVGQPLGMLGSFIAQCGLVKVRVEAFDPVGDLIVGGPSVTCIVKLMSGKYKGIAAIPMGQ